VTLNALEQNDSLRWSTSKRTCSNAAGRNPRTLMTPAISDPKDVFRKKSLRSVWLIADIPLSALDTRGKDYPPLAFRLRSTVLFHMLD
jgi:hypothetical protein